MGSEMCIRDRFTHAPIPDEQIPEVFTETINRKRFYVTPDGNKYPSITTVLGGRAKEGIMAWRKRVGEDVANNIMRTAAKRGTAVHELCENYLNNEELGNQEVLPLAMFTLLKPELDNINILLHKKLVCIVISGALQVVLTVLLSMMVN